MRVLVDEANWDDVVIRSTNVGGNSKKNNGGLRVNGVQYVTEGEAVLAKLLLALKVAFTPNVKFVLRAPSGAKNRRDVIYVPDFIFNKRAYVWRNADGSEEIVHGIECKGLHPRQCKTKGGEKVRLLRQQRGINVKMLSTDEIKDFARAGRLPMRPL